MTPRRWIALGVALLTAWGLGVGITLWQGAVDLRASRASLDRAAQGLRASDLSAAREDLDDGHAAAARAATSLARWWVRPVRLLPAVGDDLVAASVLASAARDLSGSGADLLDVADEVVHADGERARRGEIPLDDVERLAAPLSALLEAVEQGIARVDALDCGRLLGSLARACERFLEVAEPAAAQVRTGAAVAGVVPDMLGRQTPRRYLVFAASYSELRGSVGLLGSWAVMTADGGRLEVGPFRETAELPVPRVPVAPPSAAFGERFGRYGSMQEWRNVNMTSSLPEAADVLMRLWEAGGGAPIDGVLVTSPMVVERMIGQLGPLEVPGVTTLTRRNAREFIGLDAYAAFDSHEERKRVLGAVATAGFERMLDVVESSDVMASLRVLQGLVAAGDVRMYVRDAAAQQVLAQIGMAGEVVGGAGEYASVVVNNVAGNKVDFFTSRRLEHTVTLRSGGVTASRVEATFRNDAPTSGYPRYVLGPALPIVEVGDNLSLVSLSCGRDCTLEDTPDGVRPAGSDGGLPVWDTVLRIGPGQERRIAYRTRTRGGWQRAGQDLVVAVHHVVQPSLHATPLRVRVEVPTGWEPTGDLPAGAVVEEGHVVLDVARAHDVRIEVRFAPTGARSSPDAVQPTTRGTAVPHGAEGAVYDPRGTGGASVTTVGAAAGGTKGQS